MNSSQEILEILMQYIAKSGMTAKECLKSCGINTSFLTDWKSKKIKYPSYDKIVKLAIFLGVDVDWLFTGKEKTPYSDIMLSEEEQDCLNEFNNLEPEDQTLAIGFMKGLSAKYTPESKENVS